MASTLYLSKEGKVFGPFTHEQVDEMRKTGEIQQYVWLWEPGSEGWVPANPPPPMPALPAEPVAPKAPEAAAPQKTKAVAKAPPASAAVAPVRQILAVCFDSINSVSGTLIHAAEGGCILAALSQGSLVPPFARGARLRLNLLDEASGKSENLLAQLEEFTRNQGRWEYRLRWSSPPKILTI